MHEDRYDCTDESFLPWLDDDEELDDEETDMDRHVRIVRSEWERILRSFPIPH